MLILASRSPRRRELLKSVGIKFCAATPEFVEYPQTLRVGNYSSLVKYIALQKAQSVAPRYQGPILAADTIIVCGGEILEKPKDIRDARRMLSLLSGRWHRVYTGIALVQGKAQLLDYERTDVAFRALSKQDIDLYIESREPMDKAGAYAIQGLGAAMIGEMRGCYTNVIGLPIPKLLEMLARFRRLITSPRK